MFDYVVFVLLLSPVELPVPQRVPEPLWDALKNVSLRLEIVGPHERWRSDYRIEVRYVREYLRALVDAPPWIDVLRLPPASIASEHCCSNAAYQGYLVHRCCMFRHRWDEYDTCLQEARHLCQIWTTVFEATDMNNSWVTQRTRLAKLQELLGPEDYAAGRLPPAAPVWRFEMSD